MSNDASDQICQLVIFLLLVSSQIKVPAAVTPGLCLLIKFRGSCSSAKSIRIQKRPWEVTSQHATLLIGQGIDTLFRPPDGPAPDSRPDSRTHPYGSHNRSLLFPPSRSTGPRTLLPSLPRIWVLVLASEQRRFFVSRRPMPRMVPPCSTLSGSSMTVRPEAGNPPQMPMIGVFFSACRRISASMPDSRSHWHVVHGILCAPAAGSDPDPPASPAGIHTGEIPRPSAQMTEKSVKLEICGRRITATSMTSSLLSLTQGGRRDCPHHRYPAAP